MQAREEKTFGRRATCTPWCGGNGLRLKQAERRVANKASRKKAKQEIRDNYSSFTNN